MYVNITVHRSSERRRINHPSEPHGVLYIKVRGGGTRTQLKVEMSPAKLHIPLFSYHVSRFITNERPVRIPSTKSEIEKPAYSKCVNRPTRIPIAGDIIPAANLFSFFSNKAIHQLN